MEKLKKPSTEKAVTFFSVVYFVFIRIFGYVSYPTLGRWYSDSISEISVYTVLFILTAVIFTLLFAVVTMRLDEAYGDKIKYALIILISDQLLFVLQVSIIKLIVLNIALLFMFILIKKNGKPSDILLPVFTFVSSFLLPESAVSFALTAILIYFAYYIGNKEKSKKSFYITLFLSTAVAALGFFLNKIVYNNIGFFKAFQDEYTKIDELNDRFDEITVFVFAAPYILFGIWFFVKYYNKSKAARKLSKKAIAKKKEKRDNSYIYVLFFTVVVFAANVISLFHMEKALFSSISTLLPLVAMTLAIKKDTDAENSIAEMNAFIKKNYIVSFLVLIAVVTASLLFINEKTGGLSRFIFTIEDFTF